ncbi:Vacuolar calcium ion transporter [Pseudocercospora fuligena]|uniref:Vacuolar calcium ion transporter n=1 Tax=Pseudocercospora fuligena TaxID=685502 RepID=A0A8H6VNY7_9PEZI|nr:Vacuolar calcium ion transporter [Pseudocercospora fuligena]
MSIYKRVDDYLFEDDGDLCSDQRPYVQYPSRGARSLARTLWLLLTCSWTVFLIPVVPVAIIAGRSDWGDGITFALNYVSLLPLVGVFRYGSEILAIEAPPPCRKIWDVAVGAFTLDLEVAVIALCRGHVDLARAYIVGKIVSAILLSSGISFLVSGLRRMEDRFNQSVASTLASLLATAIVPFGILAVLSLVPGEFSDSKAVLTMSRGTSFVLLVIYALYHLFRRTHSDILDEECNGESQTLLANRTTSRRLGFWSAVPTMAACGVLGYFCATFMLDASKSDSVPGDSFIGYCLIPLLAVLAGITKIFRYAWRQQMEVILELAAGVSIQMAFFIGPIFCLLGWAVGVPMDLKLDMFEFVTFAVSVWIFNHLIEDGKSNYMEGAMSLGLYTIEVLALYLYGRL